MNIIIFTFKSCCSLKQDNILTCFKFIYKLFISCSLRKLGFIILPCLSHILGAVFSIITTGSSLLAFVIHFNQITINLHIWSQAYIWLCFCFPLLQHLLRLLSLILSYQTPISIHSCFIYYLLLGFTHLRSPLWFFKPKTVLLQEHSACFPSTTNSCYKHQYDSTPNKH